MSIDYISLGSRIKSVRDQRGFTQEQLAEHADLSITHLSNIENGKKKPSLQAIVNIANALSVTVDALLCDTIDQSKDFYRSEIQELLDNCTIQEARIVTDITKNTFLLLRKHYKQH